MQRLLLSSMLLLIISGCVLRSIHPLYIKKTLLFDERLLGRWRIEHEEDLHMLEFKRGDDGAYELT